MSAVAVLVLAKGILPDGSLPLIVQHELDYAIQLARHVPVSAIIVSGQYWGLADNPTPQSEAAVMHQYLQAKLGEDTVPVLVEDQSKDTIGNIVFSKQLIDTHQLKRVMVLATADHMVRVQYIMRQVFGSTGYQLSYHSHQHLSTARQYLHTRRYEFMAWCYARWWFWTLPSRSTRSMIVHLYRHHFMYHSSWWTAVLKQWLRRPAHR